MSYGELIRGAFRITLRNRYLWFFGFFVGGLYGTNIVSNFSGATSIPTISVVPALLLPGLSSHSEIRVCSWDSFL